MQYTPAECLEGVAARGGWAELQHILACSQDVVPNTRMPQGRGRREGRGSRETAASRKGVFIAAMTTFADGQGQRESADGGVAAGQ